jgi:hypothetical protein
MDDELHQAATWNIDGSVRSMATQLRDTKLLAKLSVGDMAALDAVYHKKCYTQLYNRHKSATRKPHQETKEDISPESVALAELIAYIEDFEHTADGTRSIFKLADLHKLYTKRLEQLGADTLNKVHSTRLKEKLLAKMPHLEANKSNYEVILSFKKDIGEVLLCATERDSDSDAVILMRAAQIVRKEIIEVKHTFKGSMDDDQYTDNPASLTALVTMILGGTNIKSQSEHNEEISSAALSLTQLLVFNSVKRSRSDSHGVRHNLDRETLLPLYLGIIIHNKTRKRDLIDTLFERGLSVSYGRILQISTEEANRVIHRFETDGVVIPTALLSGLYTTGNLDNADHDTSSTAAHESFHGTAGSLTQHPDHENSGMKQNHDRVPLPEGIATLKTIRPIPDHYSYVPPAAFPNVNPPPPQTADPVIPGTNIVDTDDTQDAWLSSVFEALQKENLEKDENISWSAYFASHQPSVPRPPAITGLLPLFRESAHSLAMVKHGMDVISQATEHLNPTQVPVLTVDQPLYAIAKKIQWSWPNKYGEDKYVVLMGGLHIEMSMLKLMGTWLDGSGWTSVMTRADVTTEGRADALQKGSHTSRAQWAHQVTASALYSLQVNAYKSYQETVDEDDMVPFSEWCDSMAQRHPQFCYWNKTLQLQMLFLKFLKSQREGNFLLYIESLGKMIPWMFAMDHFHYARWLTIHVKDLMELHDKCPSTYAEFLKGKFVTQKTCHKFSSIAHDQIHEQLNAMVKGDGGAIGITENECALRRWMIAGPEMARLINEYEVNHPTRNRDTLHDRHHEQIPSIQRNFVKHVKSMVSIFEEMGNPFTEDSMDLLTLDTKVIMSKEVVQAVRNAEEIGRTQYQAFVDERIAASTDHFYHTVTKNSLPLFKTGPRKSTTKANQKIVALKSDLQLFSRMYISTQTRDGDMDDFFKHENHAWPPSLAENNLMRMGVKAELLGCLEPLAPRPPETPTVDMKIIDGAPLVHTLSPKKSNVNVKTFQDYASHVFLPHIQRELSSVKRLDIVWDTYKADSLKSYTRQSRGDGEPLRVAANTMLPPNWNTFLRVDTNKTGLFKFLAKEVVSMPTPRGKVIVTTHEEDVLSSHPLDLSDLQPCNHEEADYRMMLHAKHGQEQGHTKIMIHSSDTDVVVLAVATASVIDTHELWVAFGQGNNFRYIGAHSIAAHLGSDMSWGLLLLHAISGCDNVSAFYGIGKPTAWKVWKSMRHLVPIFSRLSHAPNEITNEDMDEIERFVVLLYCKTSPLSKVHEARKQLFAYGNRQLENIPPTRESLVQHVCRSVYHAGHIWGQALVANPTLPCPSKWGWKRNEDGEWSPFWTSMQEASKECRELIKCNCKKSCKGRCKCFKANLKCTQLCFCAGQCAP